MNTTHRFVLAAALLAASIPAARAAEAPGHMHGGALIETERMPRVSIGANFEFISRDIQLNDQLDGELDGTSYSAYLGVDAFDWLTLFGTAGAVFLNSISDSITESYDAGPSWSLGLNASLWHIDTTEPEFARGRLSIGLIAQYADNTASASDGDTTWTETLVALPIGFEIPNEPMGYFGVTSLFLYGGPLFSAIDGDAEGFGEGFEFNETQDAGALLGADIYLAHNVAIGAHFAYADTLSAGANVRYHF